MTHLTANSIVILFGCCCCGHFFFQMSAFDDTDYSDMWYKVCITDVQVSLIMNQWPSFIASSINHSKSNQHSVYLPFVWEKCLGTFNWVLAPRMSCRPFLLITRVQTIRVSLFKSSWFEWLFVANYDCSNVSIGVGDFQLLFLHVLLYWTVISIVNALLYVKCLSLFHKYRPPDLITNKKNRFDHFRHLISADLWINADLIYK